jgi:tetratricopeptide (TPR) repeat protein
MTLELRTRGFLIATGASFEPQQSVPYYPFRDVLTSLHGATSSHLRSQVGGRWPYLGRLLPGVGAPAAVQPDSSDEQEWLRRAVVGFVRAVAVEKPVAVLLDDLHWADEASLDLLQRLALQTRGDRVLLLGTYRDEEVQRPGTSGGALERTLRDLHRAGVLERIGVPRMSQGETRALITASLALEVPEDVAAAVYRQTEGNPFFTQEVVQTLVERGAVQRANDRWEWHQIGEVEVPENVRLVLDERLYRLREETRGILSAASVLGQTFRFDELQALCRYDEDEVEKALVEAEQRGIVRESGDRYSFRHALTQAALYADLSARHKRRLHRAAAEALEALTEERRAGREAELAWHFLKGEEWARALPYSLLAGDAAEAVFAHNEAAGYYQTARDLARERGDDARLAQALRKLGAVLNLMGRYEAALAALEEAVRLARQLHDLDGEIEAMTCLLRLVPERGQQGETLRWVESLLPQLDAYPVSPIKLAFFNAYAYFLVQTLRADEGLHVAEGAVRMAETLGDDVELARARVILGHLLLWHGRGSETRDLLSAAVDPLENAGYLPDAMRATSLLAQVNWFRGDLPVSLEWRERSLRLARQVGDSAQGVYETCMLGYLHLHLGEVGLARDEGLQAVAEAQEMDQSTMAGSPLGLLATMSCMQGKWDDLEAYAGQMISLSEGSDEPWWRRHAETILAWRDLLEGQPARALARLEPVVAEAKLDMQEQALFLPALAEAYLETGELERAGEVLDTPLALQRREMRGSLTDTLRVHAMVLCAGGDLIGAERVLNELLEITRSMPHPFAEARALAELARLEAAQSRPGPARDHLGEACAIFRRLGARPFAYQTEQALAALS